MYSTAFEQNSISSVLDYINSAAKSRFHLLEDIDYPLNHYSVNHLKESGFIITNNPWGRYKNKSLSFVLGQRKLQIWDKWVFLDL